MKFGTGSPAGGREFTISEPIAYRNLSVFVIESGSEPKLDDLLTLDEAIERGFLLVHETEQVNLLEVENVSEVFDVFIQGGDLVKGGMQDRLISVSVIVPRMSGRVPVESFCVESGRWSARGSESQQRFAPANERISSKELKLAAMRDRSQSEVWERVAEAQSAMCLSLNVDVSDTDSPSSFLLSIEHDAVRSSVSDYADAIANEISRFENAVGFAFAVDGEISGCDVYATRDLFRKSSDKLLRAACAEAVSVGSRTDSRTVTADVVYTFLMSAEDGERMELLLPAGSRQVTIKSTAAFSIETYSGDVCVHKTYVRS